MNFKEEREYPYNQSHGWHQLKMDISFPEGIKIIGNESLEEFKKKLCSFEAMTKMTLTRGIPVPEKVTQENYHKNRMKKCLQMAKTICDEEYGDNVSLFYGDLIRIGTSLFDGGYFK